MSKEYKLEFTQKAARKYKKLVLNNKILQKRIQEALVVLIVNQFDKGLATHKVKISNYGLVYSSRVTGDIRLIWEYDGDQITIILLDIGGHSGSSAVYK